MPSTRNPEDIQWALSYLKGLVRGLIDKQKSKELNTLERIADVIEDISQGVAEKEQKDASPKI